MINVRSLAEKDLKHTIEAEFSMPVVLISPAGERVDRTVDGRPLAGRVLYSQKEINPESGVPITVLAPVVTLRESSLSRVPKSGEVWGVVIPESPRHNAPLKQYVTDAAGVVETGHGLGVINLPLVDTEEA
jgi:hypothetical protein